MWWENGLCTVIIPTVSTVIIIYVITIQIIKYFMKDSHIPIRDVLKEHSWTSIKGNTKAYYCSICESLLLHIEAVLCDCCGVCADRRCVKTANKKLKCKPITIGSHEPMKHHWTLGNLPASAICEICNDECSAEPGLIDWFCCWCQRCVHNSCKPMLHDICDYGPFKSMIIPPGSLEVVNRRNRLQLRAIVPPLWPDWRPLIVVANRKSGNNEGAAVLSMFRRLINPAQVVDLTERDPVAALEWCRLLGDNPCDILVAGGDGTVAWLLNAIHKLRLTPVPAVAILPLGTGNDLSRVMQWGKEYDYSLEPSEILKRIKMSRTVQLDRWSVSIKSDSKSLNFRGSKKKMFMYNYMSIGVDAHVTLKFHQTRESHFYLFSHRIFNKLLYLCFGTQQVVDRDCKDLDKRLEVYLDGKKISLPSAESIVVLNIPSWGAGVDLWQLLGLQGNEDMQCINDGKLEVCAIYSSFHIAQLQVGLSQPHRLGQAKTVKIKLLDPCAVQIDGEPWYQNPCEFNITYCNQAAMLMSTTT